MSKFKEFLSKARKVLRKVVMWVAAISVIMATVGAIAAGLIWSAKIGIIVALCSLGVLILCLLIDKEAAREGIDKATDALHNVAQAAGNVVGDVLGGITQGVVSSKGFLGIVLLGVGIYFVMNSVGGSKYGLTVESGTVQSGMESITSGSHERFDGILSEEEDSSVG